MSQNLKFAVAIALGALLQQGTPALAGKKLPDLTKLCKKECPEAKDVKAAMECVEKLEHAGGPESENFKKTKCYATHEKHEDAYRKMAGMGSEKSEEKEEHKD